MDQICAGIANAEATALAMGACFEHHVNSVYLGGGTPTILDPADLERMFAALRRVFDLDPNTEITVECAPGTLTPEILAAFSRCGVNRVSLGVQSFVDQEAAAVGRLHTRERVLADIASLRAAGISNVNVDLIAGLPHQTEESWNLSVCEAIATGVPHISVYMLEVDEDSRLGRELIAGGTKYHAHFVPEEDRSADFYISACEQLKTAGVHQYEISNFAREGCESRHNLKYWERQPYFGFGVDAHSMLISSCEKCEAVRFSGSDELNVFLADRSLARTGVTRSAALEEVFFLGLRLTRGVDLEQVAAKFGHPSVENLKPVIEELITAGLLTRANHIARLTARGRLLSNEVFARFLQEASR